MKILILPTTLITILALGIGCSPRMLDKAYDNAKIRQLYEESIGDAAKPQEWEISNNLTEINTENKALEWKEINGEQYILVSSWKADTTYYKNDPETGTYNTYKYPIWVTAAPELQNLCQSEKFGKKEGVNLRLKQLLGLPPTAEKGYFVEFWVRPQDLFRPCPDSEVSDEACQLAFPEDATEEHIKWVNDLRIASYYNVEWDYNYPWTELGYTYDWNPKSKDHIGLSEFVIDANKEVIVNGFYTTEEYCNCENE